MDFYLDKEHALQRLIREYKTYQSLVIAYDFDNTVYDYHQQGWEFTDMIQLLRELKAIGCYLIIFTANEDIKFVANYCKTKNIPFDAINEQPPFYKSSSRKIYYNALLDDRAGLRQTYDTLKELINRVRVG